MEMEVEIVCRLRRLFRPVMAVLSAVLILCVVESPAAASEFKATDGEVTRAVKQKLTSDTSLVFTTIMVNTKYGVVVLSGSVDNLASKARAAEDAATIEGVRSVVNDITVAPAILTDDQIANDVRTALMNDPATDGFPINVEVSNGVVTLMGQLNSWAGEQLAARIAGSVKGVNSVRNAIWVSSKVDRSDDEIKNDIRALFESDAWINGRLINIDVEDGVVTLTGAVGSAWERERAHRDAMVTGVRFIDNKDLAVKPSLKVPERGHELHILTTEQVVRVVNDAITDDPRLSKFHLGVDMPALGVVVLTGVVDTVEARRAAEQDAGNTPNVTSVKNEIAVRPPGGPSDMQLANTIRDALRGDPFLHHSHIDISVNHGVAYLSGTVDRKEMIDRINEIVSRIDGVADINYDIEINKHR